MVKNLYIALVVYFAYISVIGKPLWSPKYKRAKPKTKTSRYYHK